MNCHITCCAAVLFNLVPIYFYTSEPRAVIPNERPNNIESKIEILNEKTIVSFALKRYLIHRRIPKEIAKECKEITYRINDKTYFAIGFKNDVGGYELRNQYFKLSSAPKDIKTFALGADTVAVFEGFFDFLSFIAIQKNGPQIKVDFVVLNSIASFEKARPFMEQHKQIKLFLDNDKTGQNCTRYALSLSNKYKDESKLYKNNKDLNDWIMNIGKAYKRRLKL